MATWTRTPALATLLVLFASLSGLVLGRNLHSDVVEPAGDPETDWIIIEDLVDFAPEGVTFVFGPVEPSPSDGPVMRPPPRTVDEDVVVDFAVDFTFMQDLLPSTPTPFTPLETDQFVVKIPHAFVEGDGGLVYDANGHVYHETGHFYTRNGLGTAPLPRKPIPGTRACLHYPKLATALQPYGFMYYHWLAETLPRIALLNAAMDADTMLLTWGMEHELEWLDKLGIDRKRIVRYDPDQVYCATELLYPNPSPRITPAREGLLRLREAVGAAEPLPAEERQSIVYVTRSNAGSRSVKDEEDLLRVIQQRYPDHNVEVFRGGLSPDETVDVFRRARVVVGPHGAGLTNAAFSAPGTALVEFIFMHKPPMMFWSMSGALGLQYWAVPVAQASWLQPVLDVPFADVTDVLDRVLLGRSADADGGGAICPPGHAPVHDEQGTCKPCAAGSYAYNAGQSRCTPCAPGRYSSYPGAAACRMCPAGTAANRRSTTCLPCPLGTDTWLPGAPDQSFCQPQDKLIENHAKTVPIEAVVEKLTPRGSRGGISEARRLLQDDPCAAVEAAGLQPYLDMGPDAMTAYGLPAGLTCGSTQPTTPAPDTAPPAASEPPVTAMVGAASAPAATLAHWNASSAANASAPSLQAQDGPGVSNATMPSIPVMTQAPASTTVSNATIAPNRTAAAQAPGGFPSTAAPPVETPAAPMATPPGEVSGACMASMSGYTLGAAAVASVALMLAVTA